MIITNMSRKSNHTVCRAQRFAILDYHEVVVECVIQKDTTKVKFGNITHNSFVSNRKKVLEGIQSHIFKAKKCVNRLMTNDSTF